MIYKRICALEGCSVEFATNMKRKKFCCDDHYKIGNSLRAKDNYKKRKGGHKCPCCQKFRSTDKNRFCSVCREKLVNKEYLGLTGNEIYF